MHTQQFTSINTFTSNMLKQNKQNNKSAKINNIEQVKLEFNNDDLDEQSKKRSLTTDKTDMSVMVTPKKMRSILFEPKFRLHLYNHINVN